MSIVLRDYQERAASAVEVEWQDKNSTLVVIPTGGGKTILFAAIIGRVQPQRALVLAHREELIFQAKEKIHRTTGLDVEIEMAELRAQSGLFSKAQVVVSTIQTQCAGANGGRMTSFDPNEFGVLIIDEAHHATSKTYRKVIDYYRTNPFLKVLGVTATPDRADEEALGQIYESVAFDYEILDAINDGWLVPVDQQMVYVHGLDFSDMRTTAGDLNGADLATVMEFEETLHGVADPTIQIIGDRRTLVFAASVSHAERLCEIFNRHKPDSARWVCGTTPKDERRAMLTDYAAGRFQIVCNCGVLTEGFDDPGVEVVVMARPTKSRSLYSQMAGRSMRPLPGVVDGHERDTPDQRKAAIAASAKKSCLIVDFVGNSGRHKLMTTADILGGKCSDDALARAVAKAKKAGTAVRMDDLIEQSESEIRAEVEQRKRDEEARRKRLIGKAKFSASSVNPFDVLGLVPQAERGWDKGKQLSEKQTALLLKQGIDPTSMPVGQAKQLLNEMFRRFKSKLCTVKQAALLRKHGYDPANTTMADASKLIDAIASNGWRRPS